jgi:hypothetical protein
MSLLTVFPKNFYDKKKGKWEFVQLTVLELTWGFIWDDMKTNVCWILLTKQRKVLAIILLMVMAFFFGYHYI